MAWRIPDWEQFEPPKRKDRKSARSLHWWKCPVTQNRRYKLLVKERNGWKLLGVWHALIASWGRQTEKSRKGGVFRTALAGNKPATLSELSIDTLVPKKLLAVALERFTALGWLSCGTTTDIPDDIPDDIPAVVPAVCQMTAETRREQTRTDKTRVDDIPNKAVFVANGQKILATVEQAGGNRRDNSTRAWDSKDLGSYYDFITMNESLSTEGKKEQLMAGLRVLAETAEKKKLSKPLPYWKKIMKSKYPEWTQARKPSVFKQAAGVAKRQSG